MPEPDLLRAALPLMPDAELAERARKPFLRDAAVAALAAARARPRGAGAELARWFRQARQLGARDRPVVADAVHGIVRHEHLLRRTGGAGDDALHEKWCQLVAGDRFEWAPSEGPEADFATALSMPLAIATEWLRALGPLEASAFAQAQAGRAPLTVRANLLKCSREALAERLGAEGIPSEPCARAPHGLNLSKRAALPALESFREGWFEVQDEASQLLVDAIPLEPDQRVLDLCAGGGGKALGLAARGARVRAWDPRPEALHELRKRALRAGARIEVGPPAPAPVVLVDAPCSGTGRLRREPTIRWALDLPGSIRRQKRLLRQAAELVEPGGVLVYATCSLVAAEQEHGPPDPGFVLRERRVLWPHREGTDGFAWEIWSRQVPRR